MCCAMLHLLAVLRLLVEFGPMAAIAPNPTSNPTAATNGPSNMGSWQLATPAELLPSRLPCMAAAPSVGAGGGRGAQCHGRRPNLTLPASLHPTVSEQWQEVLTRLLRTQNSCCCLLEGCACVQ